MAFSYKTALIIGGSRGVGRAISTSLAEMDVRTIAVARNKADLDSLRKEVPAIETRTVDATEPDAADRLMAEFSPDLVILAGGHRPTMRTMSELSWEEFSAAWNADTKIAFNFTKAALQAPMAAGGAIVSFASGAALNGSPLSGGYAGAKKMQHFVSDYGKWEAKRRGLGLNFIAIYPKQLIAGTDIAAEAATAYASARSMSPEQFMGQWEKPLTAELVASRVVDLLAGDREAEVGAYSVTGTGMEILA